MLEARKLSGQHLSGLKSKLTLMFLSLVGRMLRLEMTSDYFLRGTDYGLW